MTRPTAFSKFIRSVAMFAVLGVMVSACEKGGSVPTVSNPPSQGHAGGTQVARTNTQPPLPQHIPTAPPPVLPSLEELLGHMQAPGVGALSEPPPVPGARGLRVALLLPLSGANQRVGAAMLHASEMAMFDFAGDDFELLIHDTLGTPDGAAEAARLAIGDGAQLIIGPLLAPNVRAVSDNARAAGVPVVAFSSDRTVVGDGVFTMGFFPGEEVKRVVDYAASKGASRFALLAPHGAYSDAVQAALNDAIIALGLDGHYAELVSVETYDPRASDFTQPVKNIANYDVRRQALLAQRAELEARDDEVARLALKRLENYETLGEAPFDALLVADGGKRLIAVAALLPFYDVDPKKVQILGTGQWDDQGLGAEPALLGGVYAAPDPTARADFGDKYKNAFGVQPHRLATLAYDATALAVVLASQAQAQGQDTPYELAVLSQPGGFAGRDGIFRFNMDGAVERGLAVLQVGRGEPQVIDPAPNQFP